MEKRGLTDVWLRRFMVISACLSQVGWIFGKSRSGQDKHPPSIKNIEGCKQHYWNKVATVARTSSMTAVGKASTLRPLRADRSRARG